MQRASFRLKERALTMPVVSIRSLLLVLSALLTAALPAVAIFEPGSDRVSSDTPFQVPLLRRC